MRIRSLLVGALTMVGLLLGGAPVASAAPSDVSPALASCNTYSDFDNGVYFWTWPTFNGNPNCVMGRGNVSNGVYWLQTELNGCNGQNVATDGIFGVLTERAVRNVQAANGATVDGIYGPQTRSRMLWLINTIDGGAFCGRLY